MKKVFSFIMSLTILLSTMGFTSSSHFCGGKKVKMKFALGKAHVSCGMETDKPSPCSEKDALKTDCCRNVYQTFQLDDDYTPQPNSTPVYSTFTIAISSFWFNVFGAETNQTDYFVDCSPPPLIKDIPIFTQSFRL